MSKLLIALKYFPYVLAGMVGIQQSVTDAAGQSKKNILFAVLAAAASVGEQVPETHVQVISSLVDHLATVLKAENVFVKAPAAAPAASGPVAVAPAAGKV